MLEKIKEIVLAFTENPIRITYSFNQLKATYKATEDEIREAKKQYKESLVEKSLPEMLTNLPENSTIERAWVNNKGKVSLQVRFNEEEIKEIKFEPSILQVEPKENSNVLLVYLSDKHIGAKVSEDSMLGNNYSGEVFKERLQMVLNEIINLDTLHHFSKIIVCDLGDAIDGHEGYTGSRTHRLPQNLDTKEVYRVFMQSHLDFFTTLQTHYFGAIEFRSVGDSNHGGELEWVLNNNLASLLELKGIYCVGNKFIEHFEIEDHTFLICHGKDWKDMKHGLPLTLDQKTELYIKSYIDQLGLSSKYIHFIKGDLHQANTQYNKFFRYKNVISLFGSSKWVQTNFMTNTRGVCMDILSLLENKITEHYFFI
jgi:uncharacterized protein (UPF0128 family)